MILFSVNDDMNKKGNNKLIVIASDIKNDEYFKIEINTAV